MKTVKVIALKAHPYDGVPMKVGQEYQADEKFVRTLTVTGLCRLADEPASEPASNPKKGRLNTRDLRADR